jgi:hypothetical protein
VREFLFVAPAALHPRCHRLDDRPCDGDLMRALVVRAPDTFAIEDVPRPQPGAHEVLYRVRAVTICGTDPHIIQGHHRSRRPCASHVVRT